MRLSDFAQRALDADTGDELDRLADQAARRAARYSQIPACLTTEPDESQEVPADCLDENESRPCSCGECDECFVPRATGPGWCMSGYDWEGGPIR